MTYSSLVPSKQHEGPAFCEFSIKSFTALALSALSLKQTVAAWNKQRSVQVTASLLHSMGTDTFHCLKFYLFLNKYL